jgi:hypothetical protein
MHNTGDPYCMNCNKLGHWMLGKRGWSWR